MILLSTTVREARLIAMAQALDYADQPGTLQIYSGNRPLLGEALTDQVVLVRCPLPKPCMASLKVEGDHVQGQQVVMTLATLSDALCVRSGTASWARFCDGDNTWVMDVTVGLTGSHADLLLDQVSLYAGGVVRIGVLTLIE